MKNILVLFIVLLLLSACDNGSDTVGNFFSIRVVDAADEPVAGLEVRVNNAGFDDDYFMGRLQTTIHFETQEAHHVDLDVYDLFGGHIRTLLAQNLSAGSHAISWNGRDADANPVNIGGTNVFRYELTVIGADSTEIIFQDSKYMCMTLSLGTEGIIDTTGYEGWLAYNNKLAFPHLVYQEELARTNEDGVFIENFFLSDSINIKLVDSLNGEFLVFTKKMNRKANHYNLVWENPLPAEELRETDEDKCDLITLERGVGDDEIPEGYQLDQNYPNPFN